MPFKFGLLKNQMINLPFQWIAKLQRGCDIQKLFLHHDDNQVEIQDLSQGQRFSTDTS